MIKLCFWDEKTFREKFFRECFSECQSFQWGYRGPMLKKKNDVLASVFSIDNHFRKKVEGLSIIYQWNTQDWWQHLQKITFQKKIVSWKFFYDQLLWMTLLSMRLERTDDRKQKSSFGEMFFSLMFVLFKKIDSFGMIHHWGYTEMILKT